MTTEEVKKLTIPMSERRPPKIVEADWPVIARAGWFNGEYKFQANYVREIRVREHDDGRRIVYGSYDSGNGGAPIGFRGAEAGYLLPADADESETIRAIRRVAGIIDDDKLGDECIADLPAEEDVAAVEGVTPVVTPLITAIALLSQAHKHCPADLQREIRDFLSQGA